MQGKGAKFVILCEFLAFNLVLVWTFPEWAAVFVLFIMLVLLGGVGILMLDRKERHKGPAID